MSRTELKEGVIVIEDPPDAGLYNSILDISPPEPKLSPPITSTFPALIPLVSSVAVCSARAVFNGAIEVHDPALYSSTVLVAKPVESTPPITRTVPLGRSVNVAADGR